MKSDEFDHCTNEQQNISISYNAISPYDVMSGYAAAGSAKNYLDVIIVDNKNFTINKVNN